MLPDGRSLNKVQLLKEALRCDPNSGQAYLCLRNYAKADPITLADGRIEQSHRVGRMVLLKLLFQSRLIKS